MKKNASFGMLFVAGSLLVGCNAVEQGQQETKLEAVESQSTNEVVEVVRIKDKSEKDNSVIVKNADVKETKEDAQLYDYDWTVEKTEFSSIVLFVDFYTNAMRPDSEYKSRYFPEDATRILLSGSIGYFNYFKEDVVERGFTKDVESLKEFCVFYLPKIDKGEDVDYSAIEKEFIERMEKIQSQL